MNVHGMDSISTDRHHTIGQEQLYNLEVSVAGSTFYWRCAFFGPRVDVCPWSDTFSNNEAGRDAMHSTSMYDSIPQCWA
jgi:hypothetical protein